MYDYHRRSENSDLTKRDWEGSLLLRLFVLESLEIMKSEKNKVYCRIIGRYHYYDIVSKCFGCNRCNSFYK